MDCDDGVNGVVLPATATLQHWLKAAHNSGSDGTNLCVIIQGRRRRAYNEQANHECMAMTPASFFSSPLLVRGVGATYYAAPTNATGADGSVLKPYSLQNAINNAGWVGR